MTWRCDVPGESRSFDTEAQADAAEKRIRADKGTRTCHVVVWCDGVGDEDATEPDTIAHTSDSEGVVALGPIAKFLGRIGSIQGNESA